MSRAQKQPLRALTEQEQAGLTGLARAWGQPAVQVARARALLAVSRRAERRRRERLRRHGLGGSGAYTRRPVRWRTPRANQ